MIRQFLLTIIFWASLGCVLSAPSGEPSTRQLTPFTFDDIFDPNFSPSSFSPSWIPGQEAFTYRAKDSGAVMIYNATTDTRTVLFDNTTFNTLSTETYYISPDQLYALFAYENVKQWRHSFSAKYKILVIGSGDLLDFPNGTLMGQSLQFAGWSSAGHKLSFAYENNLYFQNDPYSNHVELTTDGNLTYVFNGIPDWLYEEDVLSDRVTHYWSPNDDYICYARIDDNGVPLMSWPWYGPVSDVYGKVIQITYPKAGDVRDGKAGPNSRAELYVVNTNNPGTPKLVPPPAALASEDHYYLQVSWRDNTHLYVTWANRVQNHTISSKYDVTLATLVDVTNHHFTQSDGWIEVPPPTPWFIDDGAAYLTVQPRLLSADLGSWRHLAVISSPANGEGGLEFLTNGKREVQDVMGFDSVRKVVYYQTTWGDPAERHIARVGLANASSEDQAEVCLTCNYKDTCRYVSGSFSSSGRYYVETCSGPDVPTYTLRSMVLGQESKAVVMENNDLLRTRLSEKQMPVRQFFNVSIGGEYTAPVEMFLPFDYTPGEKFPLLVYVYAGPGYQRVAKTFPIGSSTNNWLTYLKSSHRIAVASIDGRGTMADGDKRKFEMFRKLGTVEVADQITVGRALQDLDYIDDTKFSAIFGWSYGGSTTANVMGDESQVFRCGVSVAPVTNQNFYDTAYTERYMGLATPDDNELGYNNTDIIHKAPNFQGKKFMIAHGTADDNVHFMNTVHMVSALADSDVLFKSHIYMDQSHSINSSPGQTRHLYHSMADFLLNECWGLNAPKNPNSTTVESSTPTSTVRTSDAYRLTSALVPMIVTLLSAWII